LGFLLFLPSQLGKHFWPPESFVWGLKIDYLSPAIFLSDIFLIFLLLVEFFSSDFSRSKIRCRKIFLFFGSIFVFINIFFALNKLAAFYGWLKFFELLVLIWLVKRNQDLIKSFLGPLITFWFLLEFLLSLGQFFYQGSLGGIFWWLGERTFRLATPGIAKFDFFGRLFLRPYGTFSHPNSLAGFVLAAIFLNLTFNRNLKLKIFNSLLGFALLILTFSRGAIFVGLLLIIFYLKKIKFFNNFWAKFLILCWLIGIWFFLKVSLPEESFSLRWLLLLASGKMFAAYPVFGVGLKNFIPQLVNFWPENKLNYLWLQPVHNIYLLTLTEIGVTGVGLLIWFLRGKIPKNIFENRAFFALLAILLTGLFDHYWLTLPQNFFLFGLIIGLL
jgi:hypothetical protein